MKFPNGYRLLAAIASLIAAAWLGQHGFLSPGIVFGQETQQAAAQQNQQPAQAAPAQQAPAAAVPAIKSESRVVRVDVIVTDKKGNYVHDLAANEFHVLEDNKPQRVENFTFGNDPNAPAGSQHHYLVLFFDDSTMDLSEQPRARAAAATFIDANAGADRVMAVVEFGGTLRITQNFTADTDRLRKVIDRVQGSAVSPNAAAADGSGLPSLGGPLSGSNLEANFGAYTMLLSIRTLAKNLMNVPGRKSLILFTSGFPITPERQSELTATIDACNKANVAIYPLDVRGLQAVAPGGRHSLLRQREFDEVASSKSLVAARSQVERSSSGPRLVLAPYHPGALVSGSPFSDADSADPQHGGGGGGRGGPPTGGPPTGPGGGGGGKGGGPPTGGGGPKGGPPGGGNPVGNPGQPFGKPNYTQPRTIVPSFPESASTNQQILYALASGTGGFPILNTNDFLAGLQKIAREQDEYYLLGYAPSESPEGSCHTLHVKVDRGGTNVRARSGYCNVKPADFLAGRPVERELAARAAGSVPGTIGGSLEAPFFYTSPSEVRVNVAMEIPAASVKFDKVKGKYHANVEVLGIAYKTDGSEGGRFSDEVTLDLESDQWKQFTASPMHYQTQFSLAPAQYRLTVVLGTGGQNFGKYETPLAIDPFDGKAFCLSGIALSNQVRKVSDMGVSLDADLLADRAPLIVRQMELVPSGSNHFKKSDQVALYAQVFEPKLTDEKPPIVQVAYAIVDKKTGKQVFATGAIDTSQFVDKGNPVMPLALKVPVNNLPPGAYRLEFVAGEKGQVLQKRSADFEAE
jgi:VWFA-related protein